MHGGRETGSCFAFCLISVDHWATALIPISAPWVSYLGRCRKAEMCLVEMSRASQGMRLAEIDMGHIASFAASIPRVSRPLMSSDMEEPYVIERTTTCPLKTAMKAKRYAYWCRT